MEATHTQENAPSRPPANPQQIPYDHHSRKTPNMSQYIDAFVIPIPKDNLEKYTAIATQAGALWKEHGALAYVETVLDDPKAEQMVPFPELAGAKEGETVNVAYIVYRDRAHRDEVNAKVMADPRMEEICPGKSGGEPPFDFTRMAYGGFSSIVDL